MERSDPSSAGLFIVLEGIDGSGKTEQSRRLAEWLRDNGQTVVETREPTEGEWGLRYRAWARGDFEAEPLEVLRFFVEDRREHVAKLIAPSLASHKLVICDRYIPSTLAYEAALGIDRELLAETFAREAFPVPDLILWLRLPVEQALERMGKNATERFERAEFLAKVDAEYARQSDLVEIDASADVDEVEQRIRAQLAPLLSR